MEGYWDTVFKFDTKWEKNTFLKEKLLLWSLRSSLHIFALASWVVQVSPRLKWWEGKRFKQRAKTCPHETRTFLSCSPSCQTGQNLLTDLWPRTCHYMSLMFGLHSLHCRSHILLCLPDILISIGGSAILLGDIAVQCRLLAREVPNQSGIYPAPNRA